MIKNTAWRDYSLTGAGRRQAAERGLVSAKWFSCDIDRKQLKQLMKRSDRPALLQLGFWLLLLLTAGVAGFFTWGTLWCIPAFAIYGLLYSMSDHWAHELSHGTPFKTRWLNDVFYQLASFMTLHEAVYWRWSHARHHTDTLIVGSDREIAVQRPPKLWVALVDLFNLHFAPIEIARILRVAGGSLNAETRDIVPESEWPKLIRSSRLYVLAFIALVAGCIASDSILPAMFIVLPRLYGGPLSQLFNLTQHAGLADNVLDHRHNCRTILMNPVFRFMYVNMNYHVEHHMYPMVPYHALPKLHALMRDQCAPAYPGLWAAYREIIPAVLRQRKDPDYFIRRPVPEPVSDAAAARSAEIARVEPVTA